MGALAAPIAGGVASGLVGGLFSRGGSKGNSGSYQENTPYVPRPRPSYMPYQEAYMNPSYYSPVSYGGYQAPVGYGSFNQAAQQYLAQNPDVLQHWTSEISPENRTGLARDYGVTTPEDFALWHYRTWGRGENRMFPNYMGGGMFSPISWNTRYPVNNLTPPQQKPISPGMPPTTEVGPLPGPGPKGLIRGSGATGFRDASGNPIFLPVA